MFQWRVTKYDPAHRNPAGSYTRDEWTSIADVGRAFRGVVLTRERYLAVETAYAEAAVRFVEASGSPALFARNVEHHGDALGPASEAVILTAPQEGALVTPGDLPGLCRACLRERMWCRIQSADGATYVHFGFDYYMYLGSRFECAEAVAFARARGLFVERRASPYLAELR